MSLTLERNRKMSDENKIKYEPIDFIVYLVSLIIQTAFLYYFVNDKYFLVIAIAIAIIFHISAFIMDPSHIEFPVSCAFLVLIMILISPVYDAYKERNERKNAKKAEHIIKQK